MGKKNKNKGKKAIDIEELLRKRNEEEIDDAEFTDENGKTHKRKDRLHVGSKWDINMRIRNFDRMTEELKYRAAASKFKKERLDEVVDEPASIDDVEKLRRSAIEAVQAYAEKAGLEQRYANDVIDMLKDSNPEQTVKIAEKIQDEIAKSEKLKTWRNYFKRGNSGEGWYYDPDKDDYEVDRLYGLPMDDEASKELGRILKKYQNPYADGADGWNGYWGPMTPNHWEEERMANEAAKRAQASYHRFVASALGYN